MEHAGYGSRFVCPMLTRGYGRVRAWHPTRHQTKESDMLRKCPNHGLLWRSAEHCPHCGSKTTRPILLFLLLIITFLIILYAFGYEQPGNKSETSLAKKPSAVEGPSQPQQSQQAADSDKPMKPDKPSDVFRYVNRDSGFAIDFPATWVRSSDPDGLFVIQASSPQEHPQDAFSENVYVMVKDLPQVMVGNQPQQLSLNDYFDLSRANFPKISNDAVEKEIGQIMINDQICPWVIFTHVFNSATWQTIRYYLRHEKRVYVIACTATPESFPKYKDTFQQIANSITFE
jgi:hypothetical protein